MKVYVNPRLQKVKESATLAINEKAVKLRSQGQDIVHFGFGQSPFAVHPLIIKALQNNSHHKAYLPTLGLAELRDNIAAYYSKRGYDWQASNIVIGPGSKELLFDLLYLLKGTLLLPAPSWVSYYPQAQLVGKDVVPVVSRSDNGYKITPKELQQALDSPQARDSEQLILLLNSPNNPVGNSYNSAELQELASIAKQNNIIVIADEIYAEVYFGEESPPSIYSFLPQQTIVTSGLSKSFSAGGYRLGFTAIPPAIAEQILKPLSALISETFSCVSAPIQHAAVVAYSDNPQINQYIHDCNRIHGLMSSYIRGRLVEYKIGCPEGTGSFYLFPDFNNWTQQLQERGIKDSPSLCAAILDEAAVTLLPAQDFGLPANDYVCRLATVDYDGVILMEALQEGASDAELLALAPKVSQGCDRLGEWVAKL